MSDPGTIEVPWVVLQRPSPMPDMPSPSLSQPRRRGALHAVLALGATFGALTADAQGAAPGTIYRCGSEYTNALTPQQAQARGCKTMDGGNITIIEAPRPAGANASAAGNRVVTAPPAVAAAAPVRVDPGEQRARDNDARAILEAELRKAENRRGEIAREYNNGEPERRGDEVRNYQKYLDRVAEIKASLARVDADIAGLRRELSRLTR